MSPPTATQARYKPNLIAIAEGLVQLGYEPVANISYWRETPGGRSLFRRASPTFKEHLFVTGLDSFLYNGRDVMPVLMKFKQKGVPIVAFDWIASRFYSVPVERLRLVDKYYFYSWNRLQPECRRPNVSSWPIGLTSRVLELCHPSAAQNQDRIRKVLWTHRVGHPLRSLVKRAFYEQFLSEWVDEWNDGFKLGNAPEYDQLMFQQTGRRHNPTFYAKLSSYCFVDCCGGKLIANNTIVQQHDSYKLWETFASGAVVICVDFEHYGIHFGSTETPQPINFKHYIGLQLDNEKQLRQVAKWIKNAPAEDLNSVGEEGRNWAIQWFSPVPMATRLLGENNPLWLKKQ